MLFYEFLKGPETRGRAVWQFWRRQRFCDERFFGINRAVQVGTVRVSAFAERWTPLIVVLVGVDDDCSLSNTLQGR
jgi:hypothetical protein